MKKVFVDTNILIDLLAERKPFSKYAVDLFNRAEKKSVKLYTSSHSFATTHYLLKKYSEEKELREVLYSLLDLIELIPIDTDIIKKGLKSRFKDFKDFEDSIQIYSANKVERLDFIVTRNLKDFIDCGFIVLPPEELIQQLA